MSRLVFSLLGSPRVECDGGSLKVNSRKTLALLMYLAVMHETFRRESLVNLLWPERSHSSGQTLLRSSLYSLRKALKGRWIRADRESVALDMDGDVMVDVHRFEGLLLGCESHDHGRKETCSECTQSLREAVDLYRDDFLNGFTLRDSINFDDWQLSQSERLHGKMTGAFEKLLSCLGEQERWEEGIGHGRRWIELDQTSETAHRMLMEVLARSGKRSEALHRYEQCRRMVKDELDTEPDARTTRLYEEIKANKLGASVSSEAGWTKPGNLPRRLNRFIGREREIEEIRRLLSSASLLTLAGSAGCGKTRLAIEAAFGAAGDFKYGVWFVDLTSLSDPGRIAQAISSALGLADQPDRSVESALADYLKSKQILMVLDNCEHLVEGCAGLADGLLRECEGLKILATSREPLAIEGEIVWRVPSMSSPALEEVESLDAGELKGYDAVRLFLDRGMAVSSGRVIEEKDLPMVGRICRRLDGIPLAIELAAARVRALSLQQISERLEDRFRFLSSDSRTVLPRHQTLRAAVDWSYELLQEKEQVLLQRMSVFAGGCTLEAAETVCADDRIGIRQKRKGSKRRIRSSEILHLVTRLTDKSFVLSEYGRYHLLEMVRQYGNEKLLGAGERGTLRRLQRNWVLALAERAAPELEGCNQTVWLNRLENERDNIRAALNCSVEVEEIEEGLRICKALYWYWFVRGYFREGKESLENLLVKREKAHEITQARALYAAAIITAFLDAEASFRFANESLSLSQELDIKEEIAYSHIAVGVAAGQKDDWKLSITECRKALELMRETEDMWGLVNALRLNGVREKNKEQARKLLEESLDLCRQIGDGVNLSWLLHDLGSMEREKGDLASAREKLQESLAISKRLSLKEGIAQSCVTLSWIEGDRGSYKKAKELARMAIFSYHEMGFHRRFITVPLMQLAAIAALVEKWGWTVKLLGGIETLQLMVWPLQKKRFEEKLAECRSALPEQVYRAAWRAGQAMSMEQLIEYATADD